MSLNTNNLNSPHQEPTVQTGDILLVNPSMEEFKTTYLDDKNKQVEVTLQPLETRAFPRDTGRIVLTHLVNFVLNQGGFSYKANINLELAKIREKCIAYE